MRNILIAVWFLIAYLTNAQAQTIAGGEVEVTNLKVSKTDNTLYISMNVDPVNLKLKGNQELVITPILLGEENNQVLPCIIIAGRNRYYSHLRNNKMSKEEFRSLYRSKDKEVIRYQTSVAYADWMERSELVMEDSRCGCLSELQSKGKGFLAALDFAPKIFYPIYVYMPPVIVAQKNREVSGSAYIDFVVNETDIHEDYRNNRIELQKIFNSINSVKNDPDATITRVEIKGYASPEGMYERNARLAKGRTESLVKHVQKLYSFPSDLIKTEYDAEDWEGLRAYVIESNFSDKEGILKIIDGSLKADAKEWKLKTSYPNEYKQLLAECYPALRHSDYKVEYTIRSYTDVEEAKRVMRMRPGNLSLHEFYTVANTYEPGSAAYNEVFDIMVHVYPDDETANLNAANVAMQRGDLQSARKFLSRAGDSNEANYARGNLACLTENNKRSEDRDFKQAIKYFDIVKSNSNVELAEKAANALLQINEIQSK